MLDRSLPKRSEGNFNNSYAKHWNFEDHFIGGNNINKKVLNNKTKVNKLNNLKKNNKFINNNDKLTLGELIQIDHMVVNNLIKGNNLSIKIFNAIDPITRLMVSFAYTNANNKNASLFLKEKVLKLFPFKVKSIQVDGGCENKDKPIEVYFQSVACRLSAVCRNEVEEFMKYFPTANFGHKLSNESKLSLYNIRSSF